MAHDKIDRIVSSQSADPPGRGSLDSRGLPRDVFAPTERDRLIQAMAATCADRGYAETSIEMVTARAGLSREAFFQNFSGKEACGLAAINQILAEATAVTSAAFSADTSEWDSVLRGLRALLELLAARPSFAHLVFIGSRQTMPQSAFDLYQSGFNALASMVDRLRASSPPEARQPSTAARAAIGGAEAVIRREIIAGRAERLPSLLPDFIYGAVVAFVGKEEALGAAGKARELLTERAG
jgi:AcrR family transcriptional regulator